MIHREPRGAVVVLRLDHGKANAFDLELCQALMHELERLEAADEHRAVVLTGTGTIFSAGVNLRRLLDGGETYVNAFVPALIEAFRTLFAFPLPVVAAINGHAIAGGCVLAAACDYRIMARGSGTIGVPELRVGVPFPYVAIEILRYATPPERLQELVFLGRTFGMEEALGRGLVDEVTPSEELLARGHEVAEHLGSAALTRFRLTKRQLRRPSLDRIARHAPDTADPEVLAAWREPETLAAIRAYVEQTLGSGR